MTNHKSKNGFYYISCKCLTFPKALQREIFSFIESFWDDVQSVSMKLRDQATQVFLDLSTWNCIVILQDAVELSEKYLISSLWCKHFFNTSEFAQFKKAMLRKIEKEIYFEHIQLQRIISLVVDWLRIQNQIIQNGFNTLHNLHSQNRDEIRKLQKSMHETLKRTELNETQ
jgi:hypothetical protein